VEDAVDAQANNTDGDSVEVREAQVPEVADQAASKGSGQIDVLLDTPMAISVRLGEASFLVGELLQLAPGSVLKLDKKVGERLDVFLHGTKFATGQLVVVGDQLAVRLTEILSPSHGRGDEKAST